MLVVFDLDGTLALNMHRQHFVTGPTKNWDAFFEACDEDQPNWPIIASLHAFEAYHQVEIWSGRSDAVLGKTKVWLERYNIGHVPLKMRPDGNYRPDAELKQHWLEEAPVRPGLVFDDRASVVAMWRRNNIACAQVAEGEF